VTRQGRRSGSGCENNCDFTEDYSGQYSSRIKELCAEFTEGSSGKSTGETSPSFTELLQEMSADVSFNDEVEALLDNWQPDRVKPDDYDPEEAEDSSPNFTPLGPSTGTADSVPELNTRFEEYSNHSWEVNSIKGVTVDSDSDSRGLRLVFQLDDDSKLDEWGDRLSGNR